MSVQLKSWVYLLKYTVGYNENFERWDKQVITVPSLWSWISYIPCYTSSPKLERAGLRLILATLFHSFCKGQTAFSDS